MSNDNLLEDCWNTIGSWGDQIPRCSKLANYGHCFNCEIYSGAGRQLLNRVPPLGYLDEWEGLLGRLTPEIDGKVSSLLLFSIGQNYFALPSRLLVKIAEFQPVHSIPHSRSESVLGMTNIAGELTIVVSLLSVMDPINCKVLGESVSFKRNLVIKDGYKHWAIPVNDILGIYKFNVNEREIVSRGLQSECVDLTFKWKELAVNHIHVPQLEKALNGIRI